MSTDIQLEQALAKMLPEKLTYHKDLGLLWIASTINYPVKETELLALCREVEETFIHNQSWATPIKYFMALRDEVYRTKHSGISIELAMLHASWQQRVTALAQVKGVEIV